MLLKISSEKNSDETVKYAPILQHIKSKYIMMDMLGYNNKVDKIKSCS